MDLVGRRSEKEVGRKSSKGWSYTLGRKEKIERKKEVEEEGSVD